MDEGGSYEISVRTVFAASHALRLANGETEPIHGHNWETVVTVSAGELDRMQAVMDFHDLEAILSGVLQPWQNRHLNDVAPFAAGEINPTAERVAWWISREVMASLPEGVSLASVCVGEAPNCTAIYRP
ncbi:6-pyruvoyl trahydropterin synthase family protein [Mucisphaera sp.]|uniref:6-pyruvoyl trahydropterin synthase family protein n=1 Tax=Mucisphaera sp. TaxID=2913024 RepID=UPI003D10828E